MPELPYLHSAKGHRRQRRGYTKSAAVLCIVMRSLNILCARTYVCVSVESRIPAETVTQIFKLD